MRIYNQTLEKNDYHYRAGKDNCMKKDITIVIPTRNRGYILKEVMESYYIQENVFEIIIIDDASTDNTAEIVFNFSEKNTEIRTKYIKNEIKKGAITCKRIGVEQAKTEYILFGEDDVELEKNYVKELKERLIADSSIGVISGQIIYMMQDETKNEALDRFLTSSKEKSIFDKNLFCLNNDFCLQKEEDLIFTHSIHMIKKTISDGIKFDSKYSVGNGMREETDHQIQVKLKGYRILMLNNCYCYHYNYHKVKKGGQRVNHFMFIYWSIYLTNYFFKKYFDELKKITGITYSRRIAIIIYSYSQIRKFILKPAFRKVSRKIILK